MSEPPVEARPRKTIPEPDPEKDAAVDGSQDLVVRRRWNLDDLVEDVDEDRREDHADEAVQDVFFPHGPQAEEENGDVQDDDHRPDGQAEEIIEDDGQAGDSAGNEMMGDEEEGVGKPHDGAADENEEDRGEPFLERGERSCHGLCPAVNIGFVSWEVFTTARRLRQLSPSGRFPGSPEKTGSRPGGRVELREIRAIILSKLHLAGCVKIFEDTLLQNPLLLKFPKNPTASITSPPEPIPAELTGFFPGLTIHPP